MEEKIEMVNDVDVVVDNGPEDILNVLKSNTGSFFVGITVKEGDELTHKFISKNFPLVDLLRSWAKIKSLMIKELEQTTGDTV